MKKIVFDVDDTLWDLNRKVCQLTGIDYSRLTNYRIQDTNLTDGEVQLILSWYNDPELWTDLIWSEGVEYIHTLEDDSTKVYINSNCLNKRVADAKRKFLSKALKIPDSRIILNVNSSGTKKKMIDDMFIFVDDSPFNIADSTAKYTILLDKPWNQEIQADESTLFRRNTFTEVMTLIKQLKEVTI